MLTNVFLRYIYEQYVHTIPLVTTDNQTVEDRLQPVAFSHNCVNVTIKTKQPMSSSDTSGNSMRRACLLSNDVSVKLTSDTAATHPVLLSL